jgi:hypothetical protein
MFHPVFCTNVLLIEYCSRLLVISKACEIDTARPWWDNQSLGDSLVWPQVLTHAAFQTLDEMVVPKRSTRIITKALILVLGIANCPRQMICLSYGSAVIGVRSPELSNGVKLHVLLGVPTGTARVHHSIYRDLITAMIKIRKRSVDEKGAIQTNQPRHFQSGRDLLLVTTNPIL